MIRGCFPQVYRGDGVSYLFFGVDVAIALTIVAVVVGRPEGVTCAIGTGGVDDAVDSEVDEAIGVVVAPVGTIGADACG